MKRHMAYDTKACRLLIAHKFCVQNSIGTLRCKWHAIAEWSACIGLHACVVCMFVCVRVCARTCTVGGVCLADRYAMPRSVFVHTSFTFKLHSRELHTHMHTRAHTHTHTHTHTHAQTHTYTCTHTVTHTKTHDTHTHTRTHTHTHDRQTHTPVRHPVVLCHRLGH